MFTFTQEQSYSSRLKKAKTLSPLIEDDDDFVDTNTSKSMQVTNNVGL